MARIHRVTTLRGRAGDRYENVTDYVAGLHAAVRTRQRLTKNAPLEVHTHDGDLPLAQALMLI